MKATTMMAATLAVACLAVFARAAEDEVDDEPIKIEGYDTTYVVLKEAEDEGAMAVQQGDRVQVHATGIVQNTGKKFWSTKDGKGSPFSYTAGVGKVIKGWDQGCLGMKLGEVRSLTIPAHEGYGAAGFPSWGIPPNGILNFEIEVLKIDRK